MATARHLCRLPIYLFWRAPHKRARSQTKRAGISETFWLIPPRCPVCFGMPPEVMPCLISRQLCGKSALWVANCNLVPLAVRRIHCATSCLMDPPVQYSLANSPRLPRSCFDFIAIWSWGAYLGPFPATVHGTRQNALQQPSLRVANRNLMGTVHFLAFGGIHCSELGLTDLPVQPSMGHSGSTLPGWTVCLCFAWFTRDRVLIDSPHVFSRLRDLDRSIPSPEIPRACWS